MEQDNTLQQDRSKRFLKAIGLYAIGNLGSRILTFLMVPLYTYFVNPEELGYYDVWLSLIIAFIPIITLQLKDGAFRFLLGNEDKIEQKSVISIVCKELIVATIIVVAVSFLIYYLYKPAYFIEIVLLLLVMSYYEVVAQVARAVGGVSVFTISNLICSFGIGAFSVLFLLLKYGLIGIFFANIMARVLSLIYIAIKIKFWKCLFFRGEDKLLIKNIFKYALPLFPGALCWCIMDCCGRVFVERFCGLEVSGIFAVSIRFSSIIYTISIIFIQAWQETALLNYRTKDKDQFFSNIFNVFIYYVSLTIVLLNFTLKLNYGWIVDSEYKESINYIFPLTIGVGFCVLSHFLDLGYQCAKETKKALPSLIYAVVLNVVFNVMFINRMGIWSPIIANVLSFMLMGVYRIFDVKQYFKLSMSKNSLVLLFVVAISVLMFYKIDMPIFDLIYVLLLITIYIIMMPNALKNKLKSFFR